MGKSKLTCTEETYRNMLDDHYQADRVHYEVPSIRNRHTPFDQLNLPRFQVDYIHTPVLVLCKFNDAKKI